VRIFFLKTLKTNKKGEMKSIKENRFVFF